MSELVSGKRVARSAQRSCDNYFAMVDQQEYDEELLEEAVAFANVGATGQPHQLRDDRLDGRCDEILDESEGQNR